MAFLDYFDDVLGFLQQVKGSSGRLNTSSRTDGRDYYVSRDTSESFSLTWHDASSEAGDIVLYWKNTDQQGRHMVVSAAGLNASTDSTFTLEQVDDVTAAGGAAATPVCNNRITPKVARALARRAVTSPVTGPATIVEFDSANVIAGGHEEFRTNDRTRIGPDQAIVIRKLLGDVGLTNGVINCFYE